MPAKALTVSVWSDLQAAGGEHLATLTDVSEWRTVYRDDGNHQMTLTIPTTSPGSDALGATTPAA
jgi:hypothetical protein